MRKLLYIFIFLFLSFSFDADSPPPPSGWYQQFLPDLSGAQISDITFIDSLIGYAVTPYVSQYDTAYILKTTNSGDNWSIIRTDTDQYNGFCRVIFFNRDTGYVCGSHGIERTENGGQNWIPLNFPFILSPEDLYVLNKDTIWFADDTPGFGGLFRTTNGGTAWTLQYAGVNNPDKIYMYDKNLGFMKRSSAMDRTTNSGLNWTQVSEAFLDIHFIDSLTGWKAWGPIFRKTNDGGITWIQKPLPPEQGIILNSYINQFSLVDEDTMWGVGAQAFFGSGRFRGMIYKSTDGGESWGYQIPDTSINLWRYYHIDFVNKLNGWAYHPRSGVHTVTGGGDTTIYVNMTPISTEIPGGYRLHQNYPNPFNYSTRIKFDISKTSYVTLKVYNLLGKEVDEIVNSKISAGSYDFKFVGSELPSGVYFYRLSADEKAINTRKMLLIK